MNINYLSIVLGSFWVVWRGLLWFLKAKHWSWQFLRYQWFNKQYYGSYLWIYLISWPILISLKHNWYLLKGLFKGFWVPLIPLESSKNWLRYGQIKFVTLSHYFTLIIFGNLEVFFVFFSFVVLLICNPNKIL